MSKARVASKSASKQQKSNKKVPKDRALDIAFGAVVRRMRYQKGWTQEQLTWEIKTDRAFISEIERGVRGATINMLFRIAKGFDVTPHHLIEETERFLQQPTNIDDGHKR